MARRRAGDHPGAGDQPAAARTPRTRPSWSTARPASRRRTPAPTVGRTTARQTHEGAATQPGGGPIARRGRGGQKAPRAGPSGRCRWPRRWPARPRASAARCGRRTAPPRPCPVERLVARRRRSAVERRGAHLGLAQQQPADDQVAGGQQQPGGVLADLVDVGDVAARRGSRCISAPTMCRRCPARPPAPCRAARARPSARRCPSSPLANSWICGRQRGSAPGPCPARSCGRRSPGPGSRWCPRTGCRSWRPGCTARSGSPAGSRSRRRSAATRCPSSS